ncbi:MAG: deoxyguanosinetriphosphate triphosphohydrolase [Deltaproteobacteria bacterium]|nr:deoxyguanosinetriphosphate triphosphohydrolase [Deltaproteobacteria bacterium]
MRQEIRLEQERREHDTLSPHAAFSDRSAGRARPEEPCPIRTAFQHDRDRILHSKAFRRLKHKTQVFLSPTGDHYRTRLTHTLEVSQIARTIARALRLNEDLAEAIALGHDLGHTPFGHTGEKVIDGLFSEGFHHTAQSLRVVEVIERDGAGLNLTAEVRDGIVKHSKGRGKVVSRASDGGPSTLEGQVVRLADLIAYVNHDMDDAARARVISERDLLPHIITLLGTSHTERIHRMIVDTIENSDVSENGAIRLGEERYQALLDLREFLWTHVYENEVVHEDLRRAERIIEELYRHFMADEARFHAEYGQNASPSDTLERSVVDYLAGMTDRFAVSMFETIFMPRPWMVL